MFLITLNYVCLAVNYKHTVLFNTEIKKSVFSNHEMLKYNILQNVILKKKRKEKTVASLFAISGILLRV